MILRYYGVRGSIPVPGKETIKYGGNTSCTLLKSHENYLILDAGSGIRTLGIDLIKNKFNENIKEAAIFFSHVHWDHIQGFPFFAPAHIRGACINIFGCASNFNKLHEILSNQMESKYFPVNFNDLLAKINFLEITNESPHFESATIKYQLCNHPGDSYAYRIEENGKIFVFMTDNELNLQGGKVSWEEYVNFCKDADLLIHDSQFTPEELELRRGWGHSTHLETVRLAIEAEVKSLILFHHDPDHNDENITSMLEEARKTLKDARYPISCDSAKEGLTVNL